MKPVSSTLDTLWVWCPTEAFGINADDEQTGFNGQALSYDLDLSAAQQHDSVAFLQALYIAIKVRIRFNPKITIGCE
jgi:hypothetical protein